MYFCDSILGRQSITDRRALFGVSRSLKIREGRLRGKKERLVTVRNMVY